MLQVGTVSDPIPVEDGTVLLLVTEKSAGGQIPFEKVKGNLVDLFAQGKEDLIRAEARILQEELEEKYEVQYQTDTISKALSR